MCADVLAEHRVTWTGSVKRRFLLHQLLSIFDLFDLLVHRHEANEGHHDHQGCQSQRLND